MRHRCEGSAYGRAGADPSWSISRCSARASARRRVTGFRSVRARSRITARSFSVEDEPAADFAFARSLRTVVSSMVTLRPFRSKSIIAAEPRPDFTPLRPPDMPRVGPDSTGPRIGEHRGGRERLHLRAREKRRADTTQRLQQSPSRREPNLRPGRSSLRTPHARQNSKPSLQLGPASARRRGPRSAVSSNSHLEHTPASCTSGSSFRAHSGGSPSGTRRLTSSV